MLDADLLADPDSIMTLGHALNVAMSNSESARAAYLATWGVEWAPLPTIGGWDYFGEAERSLGCTVDSESSRSSTVR